MNRRPFVFALLVAACARSAPAPSPSNLPQLTEQQSGTTAVLQAVSVVSDRVVWVSGHRAAWARTIDGGATWHAGRMTGPDSTLQFRDVHAVSASIAYLLAAGPGPASRIYKTLDGGQTWQQQFINRDSSAFFDCFGFWDADHGIAISDAVRGRMIVIGTDDGGRTWTDRSSALPPALAGEGAFAASGTCLIAGWRNHAWIATAGDSATRVYHSANRGGSWSTTQLPIVSGQATGAASVAFRDVRTGLALGGNIGNASHRGDNVARTTDGGATWTIAGRPTFSGAVYGAVYVPGGNGLAVAVAPTGMDFSPDDGATWANLSTNAYWAVGFASPRAGWAVGPGGRITKISWQD